MLSEISPIVRWHFNMFRVLGYAPISFRTNNKNAHLEELLWILLSVLVLTAFTTLTIIVFTHSGTFLYTKDGFGYFVDSIKLIITFVTLSITLCEPIFQRRAIKEFWIIFAALAKNHGIHKAPLRQQIREYRVFLFWLYGLSILSWILESIFGITVIKSSTNLICWFWMMFLPYVYALRYRDLNFLFYVELIHKELKHLEKELGLLVAYTEFGQKRRSFNRFNEFIRENLLEKQKTYMQIYDMTECFKKSSGCSMMAGYLKSYIRVVVDCYWVFWSIYQNMEDIKDILLIPALFEIPMILLTSKNCMNAVKYITLQLHSIKHSADNVQLSTQIQNFSLQLLHQKIRIDAIGITVMDGYMLTKAVSSITTYMIFFIQFMPKFQRI